MVYLELINPEFNHYFIVDYPTDIPYQPFWIKNKKPTILKKIYIRLNLFKNKIYNNNKK